HPRRQISLFLHSVEHRIKCAGAQSITVVRQLVDHPLPVDFHLCRVVQDMKSNESREEVVEFHFSSSCDSVPEIDLRYREPILTPSVSGRRHHTGITIM